MSASLNVSPVSPAPAESGSLEERSAHATHPSTLTVSPLPPELNDDGPFEVDDHGVRTAYYARLLASRLRDTGHDTEVLTGAWIDTLCQAALLHDIGKVAIPDRRGQGLYKRLYQYLIRPALPSVRHLAWFETTSLQRVALYDEPAPATCHFYCEKLP